MNNYPLIKLSALLISGISFASYINVNADIFLILFITCFTISFLIEFVFNPEFKQKKILNEVFLNLTLFLSGIILFVFKTDVNQDNYFGKIIEANNQSSYFSDVQIISPITEKGNYLNFEVEVNRLTFKDYYSLVLGKSLVYVLKDSSSLKLLPGDNIRLNTVFSKVTYPKNPGQFNYSDYLKTEEIEYLCYANNEWSFQSSKSNLNRFAAISRNYCIKAFEKSGLNNEEYALATALSFGYRDKLDQNIKQSFSNTGAMHILAVSGLHVGILYVIIVYLLKSLNISVKYNWLKSLIIIFIIWLFAFITGLSSSVLRAVTMLSFFVIADLFNKNANSYNVLAASAILLLFIDPYLIFQVSFQLSYMAVIGILFLYPKIEKLFYFNNWLVKNIWKISAVSIAAQISTFPLALFYFNQFPNYFLLTNLFAIPIAFLLFTLGLVIIAFSFSPILISFIGKVISFLVKLLMYFISLINDFPGSITQGVSINSFEVLLIYMFIIFFILFIKYQSRSLIYLSTLSIFLLFYSDLKEDYQLNNQRKIVVYSIKNHFALDLIFGRNHYFITDDLWTNKQLMNRYVKGNWNALDLNDPVYVNVEVLKTKTICWEGEELTFFDCKGDDIKSFDFGFITSDGVNVEQIVNLNDHGLIFVNNRRLNYLLKNHLRIFDLSKTGAYIQDI